MVQAAAWEAPGASARKVWMRYRNSLLRRLSIGWQRTLAKRIRAERQGRIPCHLYVLTHRGAQREVFPVVEKALRLFDPGCNNNRRFRRRIRSGSLSRGALP